MLSLIKVLFFFIGGVFLVSILNTNGITLTQNGDTDRTPSGQAEFSRSYDTNNDGTVSADEYRSGEFRRIAEELEIIEREVAAAIEAKNRSPFYGMVELSKGNATAEERNEEYLELWADGDNATTINITGWKVQSLLSKRGGVIGKGVALLEEDHTPWSTESDIFLAPGDDAIVTTGGAAGIRTSFLTNKCIGYLSDNRFTPDVSGRCPLLEDQDLASFDLSYDDFDREHEYDACMEAIERVSSCEIVRSPNRDLTDECRDFIKDYSNYAGCLELHAGDADFYGDEWRIFLNVSRNDIWRAEREAIGLYDRAGKIVDVITY